MHGLFPVTAACEAHLCAIASFSCVDKCVLLCLPRRRWVDDIRMDLQEVGCGYRDCIRLAQDRNRWRTLVSAVMKETTGEN